MKAVRENDRFTYRVTWSAEDEEHVGVCLEFPSLSWLAATPEGALRGVRRLVAQVVEEMRSNQEQIPEPLASRQYSGKFLVRVPPELHKALVLEAAEADVSLNRLVGSKLAR
jgi:predicted HicB family RNase H-like nuclease